MTALFIGLYALTVLSLLASAWLKRYRWAQLLFAFLAAAAVASAAGIAWAEALR